MVGQGIVDFRAGKVFFDQFGDMPSVVLIVQDHFRVRALHDPGYKELHSLLTFKMPGRRGFLEGLMTSWFPSSRLGTSVNWLSVDGTSGTQAGTRKPGNSQELGQILARRTAFSRIQLPPYVVTVESSGSCPSRPDGR